MRAQYVRCLEQNIFDPLSRGAGGRHFYSPCVSLPSLPLLKVLAVFYHLVKVRPQRWYVGGNASNCRRSRVLIATCMMKVSDTALAARSTFAVKRQGAFVVAEVSG